MENKRGISECSINMVRILKILTDCYHIFKTFFKAVINNIAVESNL